MSSTTPQPGEVYLHYKGGLYEIVAIAEHHDTRARLVVYKSQAHGTLNVRPLEGTEADPDGWNTPVARGQLRFTRVHLPGASHGKFLCPCCDRVLTAETSHYNEHGERVCLNADECAAVQRANHLKR